MSASAQGTDMASIAPDYLEEINQRVAAINVWAASTNSMEEKLEQLINEPGNDSVSEFTSEALSMSWYDLDDSGILKLLTHHEQDIRSPQLDAPARDASMVNWRDKADKLEALYVGCLFPKWATAWHLKKPTEDAFNLWMETPPEDTAKAEAAEAAMTAANDAYYNARDEAQACLDGGKLSELSYEPILAGD
jgi:hypothetical protein